MTEKGIFRSSFSGFNKKEVLEYIDQITAAWDEERRALTEQAESAQARAEEAEQTAATATAEAQEAQQTAQNLQSQWDALQEEATRIAAELDTKTVALQALEETLQEKEAQLSSLQEEVAQLTAQRDEAIAAVAEARSQQDAARGVADTATARAEELSQQLSQRAGQVAFLQRENDRYKSVLGSAETARQHMDTIVRPYMEQTTRQAEDALESLQAAVAGILAQLGELQSEAEQRRIALRRSKEDSDSRMAAAFNDWQTLAHGVSSTEPVDGRNSHFFR